MFFLWFQPLETCKKCLFSLKNLGPYSDALSLVNYHVDAKPEALKGKQTLIDSNAEDLDRTMAFFAVFRSCAGSSHLSIWSLQTPYTDAKWGAQLVLNELNRI